MDRPRVVGYSGNASRALATYSVFFRGEEYVGIVLVDDPKQDTPNTVSSRHQYHCANDTTSYMM